MRLIDADRLLKDLKNIDLEFMQQADIIESIEYAINKQPVVSKEINIQKVTTFDNRKSIY